MYLRVNLSKKYVIITMGSIGYARAGEIIMVEFCVVGVAGIRQLTQCTLGPAIPMLHQQNNNKTGVTAVMYCAALALLMQGCPAMFIHRFRACDWLEVEMRRPDWLQVNAQPGEGTRRSPESRAGTDRDVRLEFATPHLPVQFFALHASF